MEDKLKQFIEERRNELDMHEPSRHVWIAINAELQRKKKRRLIQWGMAAGILLIAGLMVGVLFREGNTRKAQPPQETAIQMPDIRQTEIYYASLVQTQQRQLSSYCNDYHDLCRDFKAEIDTLNHMYQQLKVQYAGSYGNEAVLNAMIENLRAQVDLLTMQLEIIKNVKQRQNNNKNLL